MFNWKREYLKTKIDKELKRAKPSRLALQLYKGKITYNDYLKSKHWIRIRERVYKKKKVCEVCGEDEIRLQVHHRNYENLGHETLEDVYLLCPSCHKEIHREIKKLKGKKFMQAKLKIALEYFLK